MKKHIFFLTLWLFTSGLSAQVTETVTESGSVTKLKKSDRVILDLYYDVWQGVPSDITLKAIQPGIRLSSMQDYPIGNSNFAVAFGAAINVHNLHSDALITYDSLNNTVLRPMPADIKYNTNKHTFTYLEVPLEIRFRTKGVNTFRLYAGFKYGLLLQEHTKFVGDDPNSDNKIKFKSYKHRNIANYSFGPTLRIGYKWANIYASYSMVSVYKKDKGPEMFPISIGLSFMPY
jgi:hypothetical protein